MAHDTRDEIIDYVRHWSNRTEIAAGHVVRWMGLRAGKYHDWRSRYGKVNEHNALVPRDHWLTAQEKQAILDFQREYPLEGYRRLTFMMLDRDIVAASPASVYRVLKKAGRLRRWNHKPSKKGTGFVQPLKAHESRRAGSTWMCRTSTSPARSIPCAACWMGVPARREYVVHWEIRESMKEMDVEQILQRAKETFPAAAPRIISDNGPQFIARDFKEFIRLCGMTHVRTSPYYPQSNGKLERWHRSVKSECIRPGTPLSLEDARRLVGDYVREYNAVRLHSSIGYVAPKDKLEGREAEIFAERDRKLEAARERRRIARQIGEKAVA